MKHNLATVPCGASAFEAAKMMHARRIGSVFVEQHGRIVGIVTEADIVRKVVADCLYPKNVPVQAYTPSNFPLYACTGMRRSFVVTS